MSRVEELEAALRADWNRDTLAVYADTLQERGEVRGELIAIDLQIEEHGPRPELVARRKELLSAWLATLPPGKVQHGFLDLDATGVEPVAQVRAALASPAAAYMRTAAIAGAPEALRECVAALAGAPRPGLVRLVLRQWNERALPAEPTPRELEAQEREALSGGVFGALVAAAPALEMIEADGYHVVARGTHPAVRRLRISGWTALGSLHHGPPWSALEELDFAFASHLGDPRAEMPGKTSRLLPPQVVPRLRVLDLSRNEPGRLDPITLGGDADLFAALGRLGLVDQLVELRLPGVHTERQLGLLRLALPRMRALERLAVRASRLASAVTHPTASVAIF